MAAMTLVAAPVWSVDDGYEQLGGGLGLERRRWQPWPGAMAMA
jgi:hypothetical protein